MLPTCSRAGLCWYAAYPRFVNRIDEPVASKQRRVKRFGKHTCGVVVNSPTRRDDATHANLDERPSDAGRETCAVVVEELVFDPRRQDGNNSRKPAPGTVRMLRISSGPRKYPVDSTTPAGATVGGGHAMTGDVHDAPPLLEHGIQHRARIVAWPATHPR